MNKYSIRFNKTRGQPGRGSMDHVWRVFENGKEYLFKNLDITVPIKSERDPNGMDYNICCQGYLAIDRNTSTAVIVGENRTQNESKSFPIRMDFDAITDSVIESCKTDLSLLYKEQYVKSDIYRHQTIDILFSEESPVWGEHWKILRDTFIEASSEFVKEEFDVKAWCFASFPQVKNLQWGWHKHPYAQYSAVMYLSLPTDKEGNHCFTTEFLQPDGKSLFVEPKLGSWFLFPADMNHRNGFWDYASMNEPRYCIAASVLKQRLNNSNAPEEKVEA